MRRFRFWVVGPTTPEDDIATLEDFELGDDATEEEIGECAAAWLEIKMANELDCGWAEIEGEE